MSNRIKVKPTNPAGVMHDPTTGRLLPPEGMWVAPHQFWDRRRIHGEVEFVDEPDPDAAPAPSSDPAPAASSSSPRAAAPTGLEPVTPLITR